MVNGDGKPRARRCAICQTNWPMHDNYLTCPRGHGETWVAFDEEPMPLGEADKIRKRYREFEDYYEDREDRAINGAIGELVADATAAA